MKPRSSRRVSVVHQLSATTSLTAANAPYSRPGNPHQTRAPLAPHSSRNESQSLAYHERIRRGHPGGSSSARITDQLNPDPAVARANQMGRSFPGLAN